jgi:hypothetical protein
MVNPADNSMWASHGVQHRSAAWLQRVNHTRLAGAVQSSAGVFVSARLCVLGTSVSVLWQQEGEERVPHSCCHLQQGCGVVETERERESVCVCVCVCV